MTSYGSLSTIEGEQKERDPDHKHSAGPPQPHRKHSGERGFFSEHRVTTTTIIVILFLFLSWVGTCIAFGGVLHSASVERSGEAPLNIVIAFKWNIIQWDGNGDEGYHTDQPFGSVCKEGGQGLLAMAFFAFLFLIVSLVLAFCRLCKRMDIVPLQFQRLHAYFNFQLLISVLTAIFFFLMVIIWGATCWTETANLIHGQDIHAGNVALTATGFGYLIFCVVIMTLTSIIWAVLRKFEVEDVETSSLLSSSGAPSSAVTIENHPLSSDSEPSLENVSSPPISSNFPSAVQHQDQL